MKSKSKGNVKLQFVNQFPNEGLLTSHPDLLCEPSMYNLMCFINVGGGGSGGSTPPRGVRFVYQGRRQK